MQFYNVSIDKECKQEPIMVAGFADAAIDPIDFPTAPAHAIPKVSFMLSVHMPYPRSGFCC